MYDDKVYVEKTYLCEYYCNCKKKLENIEKLNNQIETIREEYKEMIYDYRIRSVNRVIEYIRSNKIIDSNELDTLLCHCKNKLNGNIDGVELDLRSDK